MRVDARSPRVRVECKQDEKGALQLAVGTHNDHKGWLARIQDAFGTCGTDFPVAQLNRLIAICRSDDGAIDNVRLNGLLAMIEGASPANEIQAALAVQMALTHHAAQTLLQRALRVDQIPQFESASNSAVKLLRTFTMQAETLAKLQRGGEQTVRVVHVHPGAQAIVGDVVSNGAGPPARGGGCDETWSQPHAKAKLSAPSAEPLPQMWGEDPQRVAMPIAGGEG